MTGYLGATLIWVSWLYVATAVVAAKMAYRKARRENPDYFSSPEDSLRDPFNFSETRGVIALVTDDNLEKKGFTASTLKRIHLVQVLYFTSPIAFVVFVVGILIR